MPVAAPPSRLKTFWRKRVISVITAQLVQGISPAKISLTIALGLNLGIFPILGATTLLCAIAGFWLKLNQPVIQLVNWIASPLQLTLILVFVRLGEWLTRAPHLQLSIPLLVRKFQDSPMNFLREFGLTGLHGIIAWLLVAPFLTALLYGALLPPLRKLAALKAAPPPASHVK
jgi:uncharacterized protein (DUF2062 family)